MGPILKKLISKIPFAFDADPASVSAEVKALSDLAVAAAAAGNTDAAAAAAAAAAQAAADAQAAVDAAQAIVDAYMALTANKLKAIATQRGLAVANGDTKSILTDAIIADGGDGTVSTAEQSAIDAYAGYLLLDTAALQADADGRDPAVVFGVNDDTDEEKARALVVADAF